MPKLGVHYFMQKAVNHYSRYLLSQAKVERWEAEAKRKTEPGVDPGFLLRGNKGYKDQTSDRDMHMTLSTLHATMAIMLQGATSEERASLKDLL